MKQLERFKYKLATKYRSIKKFFQQTPTHLKYYYIEYQVKEKLKWLFKQTFDITITGLLVWYAIPLKNPVQIGLAIALGFSFYEKFIQITKRK